MYVCINRINAYVHIIHCVFCDFESDNVCGICYVKCVSMASSARRQPTDGLRPGVVRHGLPLQQWHVQQPVHGAGHEALQSEQCATVQHSLCCRADPGPHGRGGCHGAAGERVLELLQW